MYRLKRRTLAFCLVPVLACGAAAAIVAPQVWAASAAKRSIQITIKGLPHGEYNMELFKTGDANPTQNSGNFNSAGGRLR